jgi:hypothetical protein
MPRQRTAERSGGGKQSEESEENAASAFSFAPKTGRDSSLQRGITSMRFRLTASLTALLLLSGCAARYSASPGASGGVTPDALTFNTRLPYNIWMMDIGIRYAGDVDFFRPARAIKDIESCYHQAEVALMDRTRTMRGCMILDYVAYKDWRRRSDHMRFTIPAFFMPDVAEQRWVVYGPASGFSDPEQMFAFFRNAYRFVEPYAITTQHDAGYCIPGLMFRPIPLENCLAYPYSYTR